MFPSDDEVLQTDLYVDQLLESHARRGLAAAGLTVNGRDVPPRLRETAELLDRTLVRFHPSFRFEEALAARLRALGGGREPGTRDPIPFPNAVLAREPEHDAMSRGLLVGGAIASGVSLAGAAAWVAWRRRAHGGRLS